MNFTGTFYHTLDPKNRIFIPAEFREDLGEQFYIYKAPENCLCLYNSERWEQLSAKIAEETDSVLARKRKRVFFSRVASCKMDKQGRITISADNLEYASLEKDAVIVGMSNCIEIWNPEKWNGMDDEDGDELSEGVYF